MGNLDFDKFVEQEILSGQGKLELDGQDVKACVEDADIVEIFKVESPAQNMGIDFSKEMDKIISEHEGYLVHSILFKLILPVENTFKMGDLKEILSEIQRFGDADVFWGTGFDKALKDGFVRFAVIVNLKKK